MNASMSNAHNNSTILEESFLEMQPSCSKNKRHEGKEYQIAMILLQSYRFVDFPGDLTRIKVSNSLRVFSKKFEQELVVCLSRIINHNVYEKSILLNSDLSEAPALPWAKHEDESLSEELLERITISFYIKHLYIFNEIMKDTFDRFLGYL